jgi:hypothetical protein
MSSLKTNNESKQVDQLSFYAYFACKLAYTVAVWFVFQVARPVYKCLLENPNQKHKTKIKVTSVEVAYIPRQI